MMLLNSGKNHAVCYEAFSRLFIQRKYKTLALVERTHKAFPIKTDYVGLSVATTLQEHIYVETDEAGVKGAYME